MPPRLGRRGAGLGSGSAGRRDPCSRDDLGRAAALGSPAARGAQRCPESAERQRRSLQPNRALSAWRPPLPAARAPPPRARPPPLPLSSSPRPPPSCPPLSALSAVLYRLLFNPFWAVRLSATKPIYCRDKASSPSPAPLPSCSAALAEGLLGFQSHGIIPPPPSSLQRLMGAAGHPRPCLSCLAAPVHLLTPPSSPASEPGVLLLIP